MSETPLTRRDSKTTFEKPTTDTHTFRMKPFYGRVLEVEDVHFHHDSAVLLPAYEKKPPKPGETPPKDRPTGLDVLVAAFVHAGAKENAKESLMIAGHADTSGADAYNLTISQQRADGVLSALMGDRATWVDIALKKSKVEDTQQILKWVDGLWGWDCDPGAIDDKPGPKTKKAILNFQKNYNIEFDKKIPETGVVDKETWGAYFDVYMEYMVIALKTTPAGLDAMRKKLEPRFLSPKTVGCGENFPIDKPRLNNYRSTINRRVEILFFEPTEIPILKCHPKPGSCDKKVCEIYDVKMYKWKHLDPPPLVITRPREWVVRILVMDKIKPRTGQTIQYAPLANKKFMVTGNGGDPVKGESDADGVVRIPMIDEKCTMSLVIGGHEIVLKAGELDPVDADDKAVQNRLYNLGYGKGNVADYDSPDAKPLWSKDTYTNALQSFESDEKLPKTVDADPPTRARLKEGHGS